MARAPDLTLAEYARVRAALAEPFPLEDVLSDLDLKKRAWTRSEQKWAALLASDPSLLDAYKRDLDRAVDELDRRVKPVDENPEAWLIFLNAYSSQAEPLPWLEKLGLGLNDLARLRRRWEKRCREEPEIAKQLAALRKQAAGKPLPKIVAEPRRRPGAGKKPKPEAPPVARDLGPAPMEMLEYAALRAELDVSPERRAEIVGDRGLTEAALALAEAWYAARFEVASEERQDFERLRAHHRERAHRASHARRREAEPVALSTAEAEEPITQVASRALPTLEELERTAEFGAVGVGISLSLPFRAPTPFDTERVAARNPHPLQISDRPPRDPLDGTADIPNAVLSRPLPFLGPGDSSADEPVDPTVDAVDAPVSTQLPFQLGPSSFAIAPLDVDARRPAHDGTTNEIANGVLKWPFWGDNKNAQPKPLLSLEQHASLTVEVTIARGHDEEVLARYHLTPAEKAALDAHYTAAMSGDPALRARWQAACRTYIEWLDSLTQR